MSVEGLRKFVRDLHAHSGETLRAVAVHSDDADTSLVYVRGDVREEFANGPRDYSDVFDRWRSKVTVRAVNEEAAHDFGRANALVTTFERGVVVHVPLPDCGGVSMSFEPEAASQLNSFVRDCTRALSGE